MGSSRNTENHWNKVYKTKTPEEESWTQEVPQTSLNFIRSFNLPKSAKLIDIGGGDSKLVDFLLEEGYQNISVLDISEKGLEKTKNRLGEKAKKVTWIVSDVTEFVPSGHYDLWHDRATFHFLTQPEKIAKYRDTVQKFVDGHLVMATFSSDGPTKCSGLDISQYNADSLSTLFMGSFEKLKCITEVHRTPFNTNQNFLFCAFKRKSSLKEKSLTG